MDDNNNTDNRSSLVADLDTLQRAHDILDDQNASPEANGSCAYCWNTGYDGDGLKHYQFCIISQLRVIIERGKKELSDAKR